MERSCRLFSLQTIILVVVVSIATSDRITLGQGTSTASRMQNVVRKFVQQTGMDLVGLGSWIGTGNYRDVLTSNSPLTASDHDLRLVLPQNVGADEAAAKWKSARQQLIRFVNEEFKGDAGKVLEKTNLYAPNQVMAAVEDAEDATRVFVKYGDVPNLGYHGKVDTTSASKYAEGLYGDGAKAWTQGYEREAGKRFYNVKGNVFTSNTSYLHTVEGTPSFTSQTTANTARQWIEHAADCFDKDDGKAVGKYLERIERDLSKSRTLVGIGIDDAFQAEVRSLSAQLKNNPASLTFVKDRVAQVLQRASVEASILSKFESSSKAQRAVMQFLLGAIQGGDELGRKILELAAKIPIDKLIEAIAAAIAAKELGIALGEEDYSRAIAGLQLGLDPFVIGILAQITHQALESAKDAGVALVANRQDCEDLMAGILSGGAFEAEGRSYTHEQLFNKFKSESEIKDFVLARAKEAAARDLGNETAKVDAKVAEAKYEKCYPQILSVWTARRERLEAEYLALLDELVNTPVVLSYAPLPLTIDQKTQTAVAKVTISETREDAAKLSRMKEIGRILTGQQPTVYAFYSWTPAGKEGATQTQRTFEYEKPGFYSVEVTRTWVSEARGENAPKSLAKRIETKQGMDIEVKGREADGAYEGTLEFESIRLINAAGETTTIDTKKIEPGRIKIRLDIADGKAAIKLTAPGNDDQIAFMKLSGSHTSEKNSIFLEKIDQYDLGNNQGTAVIRKLEMSFTGKLSEADLVTGSWKFYLAAEVPSANANETEAGFVHASGKWTVKRLEPPTKDIKAPSSTQKSNKK